MVERIGCRTRSSDGLQEDAERVRRRRSERGHRADQPQHPARPDPGRAGQPRRRRHPADIEQVAVGLVTRVEMEGGDSEYAGTMEFHRHAGQRARSSSAPEQQRRMPFQLPVPWETPITDVYGQRLHGMTMGLRTELAVARAVDKGDLDQVAVHPLPVHERILDALRAARLPVQAPPTWSAATSTACSRRCRSTRRSSSSPRRSTPHGDQRGRADLRRQPARRRR